MRQTIITLILIIGCSVIGLTDPADSAVYQWISAEDGSWTTASNWTSDHVPNGPNDQARIDANTTEVTVTLESIGNQTIVLSGLTVDAGDTLNLISRQTIDLTKNGLQDPVLTNNGLINLRAIGVNHDFIQADATVVYIDGTGTFYMGPGTNNALSQINGGSFIHGSDHTIKGSGSMNAPVINQGVILADRGAETASIYVNDIMDNTGGVIGAVGPAHKLIIASTVSGGQVEPGLGQVVLIKDNGILKDLTLGSGLVTVNSGSRGYLQGDVTLDNTRIEVGLATLGFIPRAGESESELINNGFIDLTGSGVNQSSLVADGQTICLGGSGRISMAVNAWLKAENGGKFINRLGHTIEGTGHINATLDNKGVISAEGLFYLESPVNNTGGLIVVTGETGELIIKSELSGGTIDPGPGRVVLYNADLADTTILGGQVGLGSASRFVGDVTLQGTELTINNSDLTMGPDLNGLNPVMTNNGSLSVMSWDWLKIDDCSLVFTGSGQLVLEASGGGGIDSLVPDSPAASLVNDTTHTICGAGVVKLPVENQGQIIVENGTFRLEKYITGFGDLIIASSGYLDMRADVQTGNFFMAQSAGLSNAGSAFPMEINGNLSHALVDEAKWENMSRNPVYLTGGKNSVQYLEAAGQDLGPVEAGFARNFQFKQLRIQGNTPTVVLADTVDNGNRSSSEALYVEDFQIQPGAVLNLNGIPFYTRTATGIKQVAAGTGALYGGGEILDTTLLPGDLGLSHEAMTFDPTPVGSTSEPETLTINNYGGEEIQISKVLAGGDAFSVADQCSGRILAAGESCVVEIVFYPGR